MTLRRTSWVALALLLTGCPATTSTPAPPDPATPEPGPALAPDPDPIDPIDPGERGPVRFIAVGDTGTGGTDQYRVAAVMEEVCEEQGCDFVLLLGDNIYNTGVASLDDQQWHDKFEQPYQELKLPFYAVLGNHDWGNTDLRRYRAELQVDYESPVHKWVMPHHFYEHSHAHVDFYGIDTNATMFRRLLPDIVADQRAFLADRVGAAEPDDRWRIGYGHHPYLSNGFHGNAGEYDRKDEKDPLAGKALKDLFEDHLCGGLDLYLAGHDHDRQWLEETCEGTQFIISGAGAKLRTFRFDMPMHWGNDTDEGFVWIEIHDDTLTLQFWDRWGEMNYEGGWTRDR